MKVKMIFDMTDQEEMKNYERMFKALDMAMVLNDLNNFLRSVSKYDTPSFEGASYQDVADKIREKMHELLNERNLVLRDLVE